MQSGASHASDLVMAVRAPVVRIIGHLERNYRVLPHLIINISSHLPHHFSGSTGGVVDPIPVEIIKSEDERFEVDEGAAYLCCRSLRLRTGEATVVVLRAVADFADKWVHNEDGAIAVVKG